MIGCKGVIYVEYHTFPEHSFYDTRFQFFEDEIFNKDYLGKKKMQHFKESLSKFYNSGK